MDLYRDSLKFYAFLSRDYFFYFHLRNVSVSKVGGAGIIDI